MLDLKFIRENRAEVEKAIKNKGVDLNIGDLLTVADKRSELQQQIEELNRQRNTNANRMKGQVGQPPEGLINEGKKLKVELEKIEPEFKKLNEKFNQLILKVPNVYSADSPIGGEEANTEVRRNGEPKKFDFKTLDHMELGLKNNWIDTERGVKASGFRGYFLKNDLALLHWAVLTYGFQKMADKGYQLMITPALVNQTGLLGSGWFPAGAEEVYKVDDLYLSGTAEVPLLAYRANEIIEHTELPLKFCGFSPAYRREAGSYGKDTSGLYRLHEFWKVEQVIICDNNLEESLKIMEEMVKTAEEILTDFELPHRVLAISTGDMGVGKYKMYDLETWMPSRNAYSETHSCSHLTDWQARRLKMRYKDKDGNILYPHTLNNTVIASPRILIALLENHQQKDGSVKIPKALRKFVGKKIIK